MSRKKIYTTVGIEEPVMAKLNEEAARERRSRSFIVEMILRHRYEMPWEGEKEEPQHADKSQALHD